MLAISNTVAYHLKFLLAQAKLCSPISYCGVPSLTTIAFELEVCNSVDKNRVGLASWKNKRKVFISPEEGGALTGWL